MSGLSVAMSGLRVLKVLGSLPDMFKIQNNYRYLQQGDSVDVELRNY
jgi:hypothetical protein